MKQKANLVPEQFYSNFYVMYKYNIFSNIGNLQTVKMMTYIQYDILCLFHVSISSFFFAIRFVEAIKTR